MMKTLLFQSFLLFIVWTCGLAEQQDGSGTTSSSSCDLPMQEFCDRESSRACYIDETGEPKCGACLYNLVDFQARCISKDMLDIVKFLDEFGTQYIQPVSLEERYALLQDALEFILNFTSSNPDSKFQLGITPFSADSLEDMKSHTGFLPNWAEYGLNASDWLGNATNITRPTNFSSLFDLWEPPTGEYGLPLKVDWVEKGAVTFVKDQGRCNSCWAFVAAGSIEGAVAIDNEGYLQSLSSQQFVSCDTGSFNDGCNGGTIKDAFYYAMYSSPGLVAYMNYPYTDANGKTTETCLVDSSSTTSTANGDENNTKPIAVKVTSMTIVTDIFDAYTFEERKQRIKTALSQRPVGIIMKSTCKLLSNYKSGIITDDMDCACAEFTSFEDLCLDHAVLMVGYDDTSDPPYWKIKNTWGTDWGEDGYFRVSQEENGIWGLFGILSQSVIAGNATNVTASVYEELPTYFSTSNSSVQYTSWWLMWVQLFLATIFMIVGTFGCTSL